MSVNSPTRGKGERNFSVRNDVLRDLCGELSNARAAIFLHDPSSVGVDRVLM